MTQPNLLTGAMREQRAIVRSRTFSNHRYDVETVVALLRDERFTGRLSVDMSQGGVCVIQAEDRSAAPYLTANNNCA